MAQEQTLHEMVKQQAQELQDLRLEIESLKQMMFEHRPAFIPAFAATKERVKRGESLSVVPVVTHHQCG